MQLSIKYVIIIFKCLYVKQIYGNKAEMLNFTDIVNSEGYPSEVHELETEDGYLLDIYRVPHGKNNTTKKANQYPVLLNHGLMGSAENFIIGGPTKALTYLLADKGYDVWLCNARGTWHSRKHRNLDPDNDMQKFWKFSWHEIGYYDLPVVIDYALNVTQKTKLHYIGHSQGTTVFFVLMSERPEYNEKINVMIALAPSAFLGHIRDPTLKLIAPSYKYLQTMAESLKIYELIPKYLLSNEAVRTIARSLCDEKAPLTRTLCSNVLIAMSGFSPEQLDPGTIRMIVSTGPAGASLYQGLHYAQLVATGKFIKYDWGSKENRIRYNSSTPPEYDISKISCPVALMYGEADMLITEEDVALLVSHLRNVIDVYKIPYKNWSHMDFLWAKDVDKYMNKHLLRILRAYK